MLKIDRSGKQIKLLEQIPLPETGLTERYDIQRMIVQTPDDFFKEMGEQLLLISEEAKPADFVDDRIDLLAVDSQGAAVVIELKRSNHKLHLLQALSYAGMIAQWESSRFTDERSMLVKKPKAEVEEELEDFLDEDATVNLTQRIILLAGDFDYEVLVTSEWLNERYGVDIRCYRLAFSADEDNEFLSCTCIYPPPGLQQAAKTRRGKSSAKPIKWSDWDEALKRVENPAVTQFFREELEAGAENYLPRRILRFRVNGRRRFRAAARKKSAYVCQYQRFDNDVKFWRDRLDTASDVEPLKEGKSLRFRLTTADDFTAFRNALDRELQKVEFGDGSEEDGLEEADERL